MAAPVHLAIFLALFLPHLGMGQEPYLELLPNKILKPVGEGVYVSCSAIVPDPDLVTEMTWRDPNGEKIPNQDRSVNILDEGRPGKLDLVISKLRDQDVGEYECVATYAGNQRLSAKVMVESFMDIDFGDTPNHQTPFIYTEAKIQCTPQARPAPRVDWLKDMVALKNDDRHIIQQDGILIKNVTLEDEGTYRCRARVPQLGSIKFRDIQVEVYIPPRITHPPQDLKGVEKESVTFTCEAEGKPAPSYSWVDKDNRPLEDLEGYFVDRETGVLTILSLKPEDTGNYRCSASNQAGDDERTAHLQVLTKPKVEQYLNLTTQVEAEGEMRCVVTGQPDPTVVFKKETNEADFVPGINQDDRISVHQETDDQGRQVGILKIRQVSRSDDGLYTCTAKSEGGVTQVWGHITVEFKPTFEEQAYEEMWSWEQRPVNLTCLATSIPNATIEWYLRNQEIDPNDPNLRVMALGPLGVMQVTPLSALYFGDYTCQATNTLGVTSFDIELKEAHVPGPVADATVDKKTATTITWIITDPADDGGLPIQGYVVEYRLRDTKWEEGESKFWTKGSSYTLDGLTPMMTYIFRFAARSEAGLGEWGGEESVDMPKHAAPEEPLIFNVKPGVTEIPYPDRYTLQWSVPLDNGKEIDYFQVMYYQVQNVSGKWETQGSPTTETIEFPGKSTYTVENLHSNAHYKIELRAHNEIGFSTPAEVIIKTANGPGVSESVDGGVGVGVIIAIIIVLALIVIVIADVTCYCTRNAGLTAKIIGKKDPKDKDKEAMLDEGKNASEDKHEGNGQMKTPEDPKMNQQDDNDKNKEPAEPTETTPMIQGRLHTELGDRNRWNSPAGREIQDGRRVRDVNKPERSEWEEQFRDRARQFRERKRDSFTQRSIEEAALIRELDERARESRNTPKSRGTASSLDILTQDGHQERKTRGSHSSWGKLVEDEGQPSRARFEMHEVDLEARRTKPRIVKMIRKGDSSASSAMSSMRGSASTPALDISPLSSNESIYSKPFEGEDAPGQTPLTEIKRRPPPLPKRNPSTKLSSLSKSQEILSVSDYDRKNREATKYLSACLSARREGLDSPRNNLSKLQGPRIPEHPQTGYLSASREEVQRESAVNDPMHTIRRDPIFFDRSRHFLDQTREDLGKGRSRNQEIETGDLKRFERGIQNSRELDERVMGLEGGKFEGGGPRRGYKRETPIPRKPSSVSSGSTLYQPLSAAEEVVPTQIAFGVAAYDEIMAVNQNSHPNRPENSQQGTIPTLSSPDSPQATNPVPSDSSKVGFKSRDSPGRNHPLHTKFQTKMQRESAGKTQPVQTQQPTDQIQTNPLLKHQLVQPSIQTGQIQTPSSVTSQPVQIKKPPVSVTSPPVQIQAFQSQPVQSEAFQSQAVPTTKISTTSVPRPAVPPPSIPQNQQGRAGSPKKPLKTVTKVYFRETPKNESPGENRRESSVDSQAGVESLAVSMSSTDHLASPINQEASPTSQLSSVNQPSSLVSHQAPPQPLQSTIFPSPLSPVNLRASPINRQASVDLQASPRRPQSIILPSQSSPSPISSSRSLQNLLDQSPLSPRCYGQPTII